ncbi:hypothetical protein DERF_002826 [Dermatophagoides farinae]|uniref:Uncharacterized protein n=1 Tax=Dermatophagoides farinae TaxID=6954 RepID=A0A922ICE5_DERFA|nr:hypothetical protein DERF_002826 [Dermatophagoides farinae]
MTSSYALYRKHSFLSHKIIDHHYDHLHFHISESVKNNFYQQQEQDFSLLRLAYRRLSYLFIQLF